MFPRPKGSIRLWQTGLFVFVVIVAMLILSGSLSAGLGQTLARMAETSELRNAAALAQQLERVLPAESAAPGALRDEVTEYHDIYGGGIWVYDTDGGLVEWVYEDAPAGALLDRARRGATGARGSFASSDLRAGGWIIASKYVLSLEGEPAGVVVTASTAEEPVAILNSVRDRLWVTFWVSLLIAGAIGYLFSAVISNQMRAMSSAAAAIAAGDFDQRLSARLLPSEIEDLAVSYNAMAATLGVTFGELQESRAQIAGVVESMAEGVLALDASGEIHVANPEAHRLLGAQPDTLVGRALEAAVTAPDVLDVVRSALAGGPSSRAVTVGTCTVMLHATPLRDAKGALEGAVLLLSDVTERHQLEEAQRRFVADASHEMRTPIAAIKGMLELLADGAQEVPKVRADFIATMQVEAERLGRLVADLLTLARIDAGTLDLSLAPEPVGELLSGVARIMTTLAEKAGVSLVVDAASNLRAVADRDRIVQVLLSFTDNALKHSAPGDRVTLRAVAVPGGVRIEVSDQGPGLDPEQAAHVFERFYRADTARTGGGTGLGLAIAKEVVEAHGAAIQVHSRPGLGTTFSFVLPEA